MGLEKVRDKIEEIEYNYTIDRNELGKIMIIASTTLLFFSVHTLLSLEPAMQESSDVDQQLSQLESVVNTDRFNDSLGAIEDLESVSIGEDMQYAVSTFRGMQITASEQQEIYRTLEKTNETYQWLVLLSIIGIVTGGAIIYV